MPSRYTGIRCIQTCVQEFGKDWRNRHPGGSGAVSFLGGGRNLNAAEQQPFNATYSHLLLPQAANLASPFLPLLTPLARRFCFESEAFWEQSAITAMSSKKRQSSALRKRGGASSMPKKQEEETAAAAPPPGDMDKEGGGFPHCISVSKQAREQRAHRQL